MNKILPLLLVLICCSCTRVSITQTENPAAFFTREVYTPRHATGFRLYSLPNDTTRKALEVYRPDTMRIAIPREGFRSLLCMSSTYIGMLSELGTDSVVMAASGKDNIVNRAVRQRVVEAGYEGAMNYEAILSVKPDMALIYGIGGRSPIEAKLQELSIPYMYINDFEEQDPLGRAEWIVALGALTGVDGKSKFCEIEKAYMPTRGETAVMINAPYSGSWFIPGKGNYMSKLIGDAGGRLTVGQRDGAESGTIDLEEALPALSAAEIWLNPGQAATIDEACRLVPKGKFTAAVWNQTPDFYESGASRPDLVIEELKTIFNATVPSDTLRYFRRLR